MRVLKGNIFDLAENGEFDVVLHGCNCFCTMGSGIAKEVRCRYPEAYAADCKTIKGSQQKLGDYSVAEIERPNKHPFTLLNCYTQYNYGKDGVYANYNAIKTVMRHVKYDFGHKKIAYPLIGAGKAGGDWNVIKRIIEEELEGCIHTLVLL